MTVKAKQRRLRVWLQFAVDCEYLERELARQIYTEYDEVISMLVHIIHHAKNWTLK